MVFNTLQYARKLEEAGIPRNQAEAHIQIITEIVEGDLATKQDLKNVEMALGQEMTALRRDLKEVESNLRQDVTKLEYKLVIKLGAIVVTTTSLAMALTTWLMKIH